MGKLGIGENGIVQRHEGGAVTIVRPGRTGGAATEIEVPLPLAERYRLATGDVVEGDTVPISEPAAPASSAGVGAAPGLFAETSPGTGLPQGAAPIEAAAPTTNGDGNGAGARVPSRPEQARPLGAGPTERLVAVRRVNGLDPARAEERPAPRTRRSPWERTPADRQLVVSVSSRDVTGRMLDFAAPLGLGGVGAIVGPHGAGHTVALEAVAAGIEANVPDCLCVVLLLRARGEEMTEWRRRFPRAEVVVCPSTFAEGGAQRAMRVADLVLEAALRQTELGHDVVLLLDSLTGLWGAMLEVEEADAQTEADQAWARRRLREWVQHAGCFHGEMPLGGELGGSLTIVGSVWHEEVDEEVEEERELHPHLRLLEHLTQEATWRVTLSGRLAGRRLYPAIDPAGCQSRDEQHFLAEGVYARLQAARAALPSDIVACHNLLGDAIDATEDLESLLDALPSDTPRQDGAALWEALAQSAEARLEALQADNPSVVPDEWLPLLDEEDEEV